jgi:hypothetical protein
VTIAKESKEPQGESKDGEKLHSASYDAIVVLVNELEGPFQALLWRAVQNQHKPAETFGESPEKAHRNKGHNVVLDPLAYADDAIPIFIDALRRRETRNTVKKRGALNTVKSKFAKFGVLLSVADSGTAWAKKAQMRRRDSSGIARTNHAKAASEILEGEALLAVVQPGDARTLGSCFESRKAREGRTFGRG